MTNFIAPIAPTGYGVVAYNLLKALSKRRHHVSLFPKGNISLPDSGGIIAQALQNAKFFKHDDPCLAMWHQFDLSRSIGKGKYVAYPFFELDTFTDGEIHHLEYPDELIASSEWARNVVLNNTVHADKIHVISPGVDLDVFYPTTPNTKKEVENFVFLNCGKWEIRKGHDVLIDVFNKAFDVDDKVELWMMPTNQFLNKEEALAWEQMYLNSKMGRAGKIKILPWMPSHHDVAYAMNQADCGIFPSRAEGWNLELLEMMACGKDVIATDYSAHTEFCNDDNCWLIKVGGMEPAYDGRWFFEQGNWAILDDEQEEQMIFHMRNVVGLGSVKNVEGVQTAQRFTWDIMAEKVERILTS